MAFGRPFLEEEDRTPGTHPVAILGYRIWVQDFGEDPGILGRSIQVNGRPYTVVGVAPPEFTGSLPVLVSGLYIPLMMTDEIMASPQLEPRGSRSMFLKGQIATRRVPGAGERVAAGVLGVSRGALPRVEREPLHVRDLLG